MSTEVLRIDPVANSPMRIVYDGVNGGPTGHPHFPETVDNGFLQNVGSATRGSLVAKAGGYCHANSSPDGFHYMDGFDADCDTINEGTDDVTSVAFVLDYSATREYVHGPFIDDAYDPAYRNPPISDPPVAILGIFMRPSDSPGYFGTFDQSILNSSGWIEAQRLGLSADGVRRTISDGFGTGPGFRALPQTMQETLAGPNGSRASDNNRLITCMAFGGTSSELATITIYGFHIEITHTPPEEVLVINDEFVRGRYTA